MKRTLPALLLVLLGLVAQADAAPAPFSKPVRHPDEPLTADRLKQILLSKHNIYADSITQDGSADIWLVTGNTPLVTHDGRMAYQQRQYRVTAKSTGERGGTQLTLTYLSPYRYAITR